MIAGMGISNGILMFLGILRFLRNWIWSIHCGAGVYFHMVRFDYNEPVFFREPFGYIATAAAAIGHRRRTSDAASPQLLCWKKKIAL